MGRLSEFFYYECKSKINMRATMALGRSPEYHWNQIISKSVYLFSRRSRWEGGGGLE